MRGRWVFFGGCELGVDLLDVFGSSRMQQHREDSQRTQGADQDRNVPGCEHGFRYRNQPADEAFHGVAGGGDEQGRGGAVSHVPHHVAAECRAAQQRVVHADATPLAAFRQLPSHQPAEDGAQRPGDEAHRARKQHREGAGASGAARQARYPLQQRGNRAQMRQREGEQHGQADLSNKRQQAAEPVAPGQNRIHGPRRRHDDHQREANEGHEHGKGERFGHEPLEEADDGSGHRGSARRCHRLSAVTDGRTR